MHARVAVSGLPEPLSSWRYLGTALPCSPGLLQVHRAHNTQLQAMAVPSKFMACQMDNWQALLYSDRQVTAQQIWHAPASGQN